MLRSFLFHQTNRLIVTRIFSRYSIFPQPKLAELCKEKKFLEVQNTLDILPNVTELDYQAVILECCSQNHFAPSLEFFNSMKKEGFKPSETIFFSLINSCGDPEGKKDLLAEMKAHGYRPSLFLYNKLVRYFLDEEDFDQAGKFIEEMRENHLELDVWGFNNLIDYQLKISHAEDALVAFNEMEAKGIEPSILTFNNILSYFTKKKYWATINKAFDALNTHSIKPDRATYHIMLRGKIHQGKLPEAVEIFNKMEKSGFKPARWVYLAIIEQYLDRLSTRDVKMWRKKLGEDNPID